jgi:hypothetical protein
MVVVFSNSHNMMLGRAAVATAFLIVCFTCSCCTITMSHAFRIEPFAPSAITKRKISLSRFQDKHSSSTALAAFLPSLLDPAISTTMDLLTALTFSGSMLLSANTHAASSDFSIFDSRIVYVLFLQLYLLLILFPTSRFTKQTLGSFEMPATFTLIHVCTVYFCLYVLSYVDPAATDYTVLRDFLHINNNDMASLSDNATTSLANVAIALHRQNHPVLTFDFFVPWWVWRDGIRRNMFTSHSILLCWFLGPSCGLLLHWLTCFLTGNSTVDKADQITDDD